MVTARGGRNRFDAYSPPIGDNGGYMKLCALAALLLAGSVSVAAEVQIIEEIIAKVNGEIITRGDLQRAHTEAEAAMRQQNVGAAKQPQMLAEFDKNALRDKIDQLLLAQKGKDLDLKVESDVTRQIAEIQKQVGIADPDKFHDMVREQTGMSFEDYKQDMTNELLRQRVIRQEVMSRMQLPHQEIEAYYNQHKSEFVREECVFLREILISTEGKDEAGVAAAKKKADDLVKRARNGEKFGQMALENSSAVTAKQGGDLGGWKKGELAGTVEAAVWNQPRGYVTDAIRVANGFLILKVEDHHKAGQATLEEVEPEITDKILSPKMQPALREYLTKLRENAFLEIKPGYVDSGAAPHKDTRWMEMAQLKPETVTKAEVANSKKHKKLLGVPIPGTSSSSVGKSSSR
jgi:peptidyl-prolyl cis-trans isomerase SurA